MNGQSLDVITQKLEQLKQIMPEVFTEGKLDWEKLCLTLGEKIEFNKERYVLNWAGKTEAYRLVQTPTYSTLKAAREESLDFDTTENIFIEGDNLEVLKVLQKSYFGKIKMIYIDPPYNTGNNFIYKDDFSESVQEYKEKIRDIDENGNATKSRLFRNKKDNGRFHSNWLNMMFPRLFLARNLLKEDGVIFVSIDDNEVHNLHLLMDEIFGEENFIATFVWDTKKAAQGMITQNRIVCNHEYILTYAKKKEAFQFLGLKRSTKGFSNPDNDKRGLWKRQYLQRLGQGLPVRTIIDPLTKRKYTFETPYSQEKLEQWIQEGRILFPKDGKGYPARKEFLEEYSYNQQLVTSLGLFATKSTTEKLYKLFEDIKIFTNPKPDNLINFLLEVTTQKEDLILDFFAGSATTAQAVMELNKKDKGKRKFILVQLDEPCEKETEAYKAGYKTIAEICKERIRKVANNIKQELEKEKKKNLDLGFKVFKLSKSNFKQWRPFKAENEEQIKQAILEFVDNVQPDANKEDILYELMLKNGKQLTEKKENKNGYYIIGKNEIVFILEKIDKEMIEEILNLKPQKIIVLDKLFNGNASFKTNIYLQFKDAGVEFKSV